MKDPYKEALAERLFTRMEIIDAMMEAVSRGMTHPEIYKYVDSLPAAPVQVSEGADMIAEIRRRVSIIHSEPDGEVRETMIGNLDIDLENFSSPPQVGKEWPSEEKVEKITSDIQKEWQMGGLYSGIYKDMIDEVLKRVKHYMESK